METLICLIISDSDDLFWLHGFNHNELIFTTISFHIMKILNLERKIYIKVWLNKFSAMKLITISVTFNIISSNKIEIS